MSRIVTAIAAASLLIMGCTGVPDGLAPVADFDLHRYMGKWYEIARLDHSFERNLSNVSATYTLEDNGAIQVQNRGFDTDRQVWKSIEGNARLMVDDSTGSLKVSFFGPFYSGYHIIALDRESYEYAMITGPNRSYLWILARDKIMDPAVFSELVSKARKWGFNTNQLIKVEHNLPG